MSSHPEQPQQPTIRHIPIYVEGRSEPLVNTVPETKASAPNPMPEAPRMEMPTHNTGDFFTPGNIFNRARDFPVRTFPNSSFFNRDHSPGRQVPTFNDIGSHAAPEQPAATNVPRGTSTTLPRKTPSPPTAQSHPQQQHQQTHFRHQQQAPQQQPSPPQPQPQQPKPQSQQQHSQPSQPQPMEPPGPGQDQPDCRPKVTAVKEDPITKIQRIQKDVLDIFDQVENFQGGREGKKDKRYVYLDEMLTQNLLKLDSIDAEDQPQIKSARREAIKSINKCIAVLEAKAEAGGTNSAANSGSSINSGHESSDPRANGTAAIGVSQSNASLTHSSSNSSQQQQQNKASAQQ